MYRSTIPAPPLPMCRLNSRIPSTMFASSCSCATLSSCGSAVKAFRPMRGKTDSRAAAISRSAGRSAPSSRPARTTRKLKIFRYSVVSASTSLPGLSRISEISPISPASLRSRSARASSTASPSCNRAASTATCIFTVSSGGESSSHSRSHAILISSCTSLSFSSLSSGNLAAFSRTTARAMKAESVSDTCTRSAPGI